jgi:ribosomal protein S18 acetylase RimI-like enzyme
MNTYQVNINELGQVAKLFDEYRIFYQQESDLPKATAFIKERMTLHDSAIFVVENQQNEVIGFTQLYPSFSSVTAQRSWILNDLFVKEKYRGNGFGKALLDQAKYFAASTHAKGLSLMTAESNLNAQKLYESQGYQKQNFLSYFLPV